MEFVSQLVTLVTMQPIFDDQYYSTLRHLMRIDPYTYVFQLYLDHTMTVNAKLDVSDIRVFQGSRFHW